MAPQAGLIASITTFMQPQVRRRGRPARPRPCASVLLARRQLSERLSAACAAAWFGVAPTCLDAATRGKAREALARQTAIYFAHVVFRASLTRAGGIFGRDRTTARHACMLVEDRRDCTRFDRACNALEPALHRWLESFGGEDGGVA